MAIGAALIFISGRTLLEDVLLGLAGLFAPVVAVIPTTDVGTCWSTPPPVVPVGPDGLATWVVAGVDNNVPALLVMGVVGVVAMLLIPPIKEGRSPLEAVRSSAPSSRLALAVIAAVLLGGWWAYARWDGFLDHAHAWAAVAMFVFLASAVALNAWENRDEPRWFRAYLAIAVLMPVGGFVTYIATRGLDHTVFAVEVVEIALFTLFWILQTWQHWGSTLPPAGG